MNNVPSLPLIPSKDGIQFNQSCASFARSLYAGSRAFCNKYWARDERRIKNKGKPK